jgi:hypothetical protein
MIRIRAAAIHFCASAVIVLLLLVLVTQVWYPAPFFELANARRIFLILAGCDATLGPLITLIIFNVKKPKRELARDIAMIAAVQLAAMSYGAWTLLEVRPAFIVYSSGQFNVLLANEVSDTETQTAALPANPAPWTGPRTVGVGLPKDRDERFRVYQAAMAKGVATYEMSRYYVPYTNVQAEVIGKIHTPKQFADAFKLDESDVNRAVEPYVQAGTHFGLVPLKIRESIAAAVIDSDSGALLQIEPLPPPSAPPPPPPPSTK